MIKILATGFGPFPGARHNPSLALIQSLRHRRARLARLGIALELGALPVTYAGLERQLAALVEASRPDAILHFGLASRRRIISIERQAYNHVSLLHPDAAGACPKASSLLAGGPRQMQARVPVRQILAALQREGFASGLSHDAGAYLCNALFYRSLVAQHAACVGFIHIPNPRPRSTGNRTPQRRQRPRFAELVKAAEIALVITAIAARQRVTRQACAMSASVPRSAP